MNSHPNIQCWDKAKNPIARIPAGGKINMDKNFSKDVIKGKIAEIIFELMFREAGKYTVIPFGYEKTFPELIQYSKRLPGAQKVIDNIKNAPDFAIISNDRKRIYLVEVKYPG